MKPVPQAVEITLPGGFAAGEEWHRKVWLRPWNGADAQYGGDERTSAAVRTTAILARCLLLDGSAPDGSELVRGLNVGDREALLLHLRRITLGDRLDCVLTCPACTEKMDLELSLSDLLLPPYEHSQSTHSHTLSVDDRSYDVHFRLPTGADQEAVAELAKRDAATAARTVLKRCVEQINGTAVDPIPAAVVEALPKVMAELDPQAELSLHAVCPICQAEFETLFDAALFVHRELDQTWRRIHREVHLLASHYHWSEADILAMNDSKRLVYIELVREELGSRRAQAL